jgi:uncharacterized Zn-finger protein
MASAPLIRIENVEEIDNLPIPIQPPSYNPLRYIYNIQADSSSSANISSGSYSPSANFSSSSYSPSPDDNFLMNSFSDINLGAEAYAERYFQYQLEHDSFSSIFEPPYCDTSHLFGYTTQPNSPQYVYGRPSPHSSTSSLPSVASTSQSSLSVPKTYASSPSGHQLFGDNNGVASTDSLRTGCHGGSTTNSRGRGISRSRSNRRTQSPYESRPGLGSGLDTLNEHEEEARYAAVQMSPIAKEKVTSPATRKASRDRRRTEAKHVCSICGETFTTKHNLKNHKNSHMGTKSHPCGTCDKPFNTKSDRKRHEKIHDKNPLLFPLSVHISPF